MNIAFHFPGQGSQSVGMLAELDARFSIVKQLFEQASEILGYNLWQLSQHGPKDTLNQTQYTQPVLFVADVAVWHCWRAMGGADPALLAGHSLGEYVALLVAESLTFESALKTVAFRAQVMQRAVPEGVGAMAAIIGLDDSLVKSVCQDAANEEVVSVASYNAIGQTVIAGQSAAVDRAVELAKQRGAKLARRIAVSVPSHCRLMQPAADALADKLATVELQPPKIPVIHNCDVECHDTIDAIRQALVQQLVMPVRWVETVLKMQRHDIDLFIECGPNKVLAGLNKRIVKSITTQSINNPDDLQLAIRLQEEIQCR